MIKQDYTFITINLQSIFQSFFVCYHKLLIPPMVGNFFQEWYKQTRWDLTRHFLQILRSVCNIGRAGQLSTMITSPTLHYNRDVLSSPARSISCDLAVAMQSQLSSILLGWISLKTLQSVVWGVKGLVTDADLLDDCY